MRVITHTQKSSCSFPYGLTANVNSLQGKCLHLEQTIVNLRNLCFIALKDSISSKLYELIKNGKK